MEDQQQASFERGRAHYDTARERLAAGDIVAAVAAFELAAYETQFVAEYEYANFYNDWAEAVSHGDPERAVGLYDRAIAKEGDNGHALLKRGLLLDQLGRVLEARESYERADAAFWAFTRRVPHGGDYPDHLFSDWAAALFALGAVGTARRRLERALQHNPAHQTSQQLLASLSRHVPPDPGVLSRTLQTVGRELNEQTPSALGAVRRVLHLHREYAASRAQVLVEGADPTQSHERAFEDWIRVARRAYPHGVLDGRRLILGLALSSRPLFDLLKNASLLGSFSSEVLSNTLAHGLGRRCVLGFVRSRRGIPALPAGDPALLEPPLLVLHSTDPSEGVAGALQAVVRFLARRAAGTPPEPAAEKIQLIDFGPALPSGRFAQLCRAAATAPALLTDVLEEVLEGGEQLLLLVDAQDSSPNLSAELDALNEELFEDGRQRLVVLIRGVAAEVPSHERVSLELVFDDDPLSNEEVLDFLYHFFVFDPAIDAALLESPAVRGLAEAYSRRFSAPPSTAQMRMHLARWSQTQPAPEGLWRRWALATRADALASIARAVAP